MYVLDVGKPSPFALEISPTASLSAKPSVDRDHGFPSNNRLPSPSISTPNIPTASEPEGENTEVEENGDDDAEGAFYRDLRRQEEERRRRLSARRIMGLQTSKTRPVCVKACLANNCELLIIIVLLMEFSLSFFFYSPIQSLHYDMVWLLFFS
jgi:hypothetical protein